CSPPAKTGTRPHPTDHRGRINAQLIVTRSTRATTRMVAMQHEFRITGHWQGGRAGVGEAAAHHVSTMISLPRGLGGSARGPTPGELGGSARGTNPEEMLFSTAAACYLITLGIILEKRGIATDRLEVVSTGTMDDEKLKITRIVHEPKVVLASAPTAEQRSSI